MALYFGGVWIFDFDAGIAIAPRPTVELKPGISRPAAALNPRRVAADANQSPVADWTKSAETASPVVAPAAARTYRAPSPSTDVVAIPAAAPLSLPFTYVGTVRTDGASTAAALARGERVILVKQGETVDGDFRLVALSPPTVLHVASGTRMIVPTKAETPLARSPTSPTAVADAASVITSMPAAGGRPSASPSPTAFNARDVAAIEAEVARALAALPPPPTLVPSSFPLAR